MEHRFYQFLPTAPKASAGGGSYSAEDPTTIRYVSSSSDGAAVRSSPALAGLAEEARTVPHLVNGNAPSLRHNMPGYTSVAVPSVLQPGWAENQGTQVVERVGYVSPSNLDLNWALLSSSSNPSQPPTLFSLQYPPGMYENLTAPSHEHKSQEAVVGVHAGHPLHSPADPQSAWYPNSDVFPTQVEVIHEGLNSSRDQAIRGIPLITYPVHQAALPHSSTPPPPFPPRSLIQQTERQCHHRSAHSDPRLHQGHCRIFSSEDGPRKRQRITPRNPPAPGQPLSLGASGATHDNDSDDEPRLSKEEVRKLASLVVNLCVYHGKLPMFGESAVHFLRSLDTEYMRDLREKTSLKLPSETSMLRWKCILDRCDLVSMSVESECDSGKDDGAVEVEGAEDDDGGRSRDVGCQGDGSDNGAGEMKTKKKKDGSVKDREGVKEKRKAKKYSVGNMQNYLNVKISERWSYKAKSLRRVLSYRGDRGVIGREELSDARLLRALYPWLGTGPLGLRAGQVTLAVWRANKDVRGERLMKDIRYARQRIRGKKSGMTEFEYARGMWEDELRVLGEELFPGGSVEYLREGVRRICEFPHTIQEERVCTEYLDSTYGPASSTPTRIPAHLYRAVPPSQSFPWARYDHF